MTWIKTVPFANAGPELREAMREMRGKLPPEYGAEPDSLKELASQAAGGGITQSHSLIPEAFRHAFGTHLALMSPDLPLTRRQHEMISATVSVLNHCFY